MNYTSSTSEYLTLVIVNRECGYIEDLDSFGRVKDWSLSYQLEI